MMDSLPSEREGRSGLIVANIVGHRTRRCPGAVAALFIPAKENILNGVVLLAIASTGRCWPCCRHGSANQPQRWAAAPAVFLAVAGLISLLPPGSVVQDVFGWVCGTSKSGDRLGVPEAIEIVVMTGRVLGSA